MAGQVEHENETQGVYEPEDNRYRTEPFPNYSFIEQPVEGQEEPEPPLVKEFDDPRKHRIEIIHPSLEHRNYPGTGVENRGMIQEEPDGQETAIDDFPEGYQPPEESFYMNDPGQARPEPAVDQV